MADQDGTTAATSGDGGTGTQADPAATTQPQAGTSASPGGSGSGDNTISEEDARKLRSEAKNLRDRAKQAEDELQRLKAAGMSDTERKDRDLETANAKAARLEDENRGLRVQVAAVKVGIRADATDAAAALLDWATVDDPSDAKALERALKALVKERPFLSGVAGTADAGAGNGEQAETSDMNALLRRAVGIR